MAVVLPSPSPSCIAQPLQSLKLTSSVSAPSLSSLYIAPTLSNLPSTRGIISPSPSLQSLSSHLSDHSDHPTDHTDHTESSDHDIDHVDIEEIVHSKDRTKKKPPSKRRRKRGPPSAASAFSFFVDDIMPDMVHASPNASPEQIMKALTQRWEAMNEYDRTKYIQLSIGDHQRYEEQIKEYLPKTQDNKLLQTKKKKHPDAPKHPKSAYLHFVAEHRAKLRAAFPEKNFVSIAQFLGQQWAALPSSQKLYYEQIATRDKERYKIEKQSFTEIHPEGMNTVVATSKSVSIDIHTQQQTATTIQLSNHTGHTLHRSNSATDLKKRRKHPLAPRHPLSAYLYFVATNRNKILHKYPNSTFTEIAKILGDKWKTLNSDEKKKYEMLAYIDRQRYDDEKKKWKPPNELETLKEHRKLNKEYKESSRVEKRQSPTNTIPVVTPLNVSTSPSSSTHTRTMSQPSPSDVPLKKPPTAYAAWSKIARAKAQGTMDKRELTKHLKDAWKNMGEIERMKWEHKADDERRLWAAAMNGGHLPPSPQSISMATITTQPQPIPAQPIQTIAAIPVNNDYSTPNGYSSNPVPPVYTPLVHSQSHPILPSPVHQQQSLPSQAHSQLQSSLPQFVPPQEYITPLSHSQPSLPTSYSTPSFDTFTHMETSFAEYTEFDPDHEHHVSPPATPHFISYDMEYQFIEEPSFDYNSNPTDIYPSMYNDLPEQMGDHMTEHDMDHVVDPYTYGAEPFGMGTDAAQVDS